MGVVKMPGAPVGARAREGVSSPSRASSAAGATEISSIPGAGQAAETGLGAVTLRTIKTDRECRRARPEICLESDSKRHGMVGFPSSDSGHTALANGARISVLAGTYVDG